MQIFDNSAVSDDTSLKLLLKHNQKWDIHLFNNNYCSSKVHKVCSGTVWNKNSSGTHSFFRVLPTVIQMRSEFTIC